MVIHRVLRQESQANLPCERFHALQKFVPLHVGELADFGIGPRVIDQCCKLGDLLVGAAICPYCLDNRAEFGEFPRQPDVGIGSQSGGKLAFHHRVAGEQGIHFLLWQDYQSCNPSAAAKPSSFWRIDTLPTGFSRQGNSMASPLRQSRSRSNAFTGPTAEGVSESVR